MTRSPRIKFGLSALATGYNFRTGQGSQPDIMALLSDALRCVHDDQRAREMVLEFVQVAPNDPKAAGMALLDQVYEWLQSLPLETRFDIEKSATPGALYDLQERSVLRYPWQDRADLK